MQNLLSHYLNVSGQTAYSNLSKVSVVCFFMQRVDHDSWTTFLKVLQNNMGTRPQLMKVLSVSPHLIKMLYDKFIKVTSSDSDSVRESVVEFIGTIFRGKGPDCWTWDFLQSLTATMSGSSDPTSKKERLRFLSKIVKLLIDLNLHLDYTRERL